MLEDRIIRPSESVYNSHKGVNEDGAPNYE